ncbi:MAG: serine hydrolase [Kiritimatiellia bacterium]|nr:serine hydrolase [Kiritimatiellia bacterium]
MKPIMLFFHFLIGGAFLLATGCSDVSHKEAQKNVPISGSNAWSNFEEYLSQRPAPVPVAELKSSIENLLTNSYVKGQYSLYFEDLNSGAWFGINETNRYNQWSLLKVKVAVTVLKKVERREVALDKRVKLIPADLDTATLLPASNQAGDELTVRELLERLIRYSDNTASFALSRLFKADEFQDTLLAVGTLPAPADKPKNFLPPVSPKEYANALRDLYFAKYLSKPSSELVLALMADTVYDNQLRMGLPPDIRVAHKVGFNADCGEFHDCGIVYLPGAPYILCVMSKNSTREEADRVIREISRQIYEYLTR